MHKYLLLFLMILLCGTAFAQQRSRFGNMSGRAGNQSGPSKDSIHFEHRDDALFLATFPYPMAATR